MSENLTDPELEIYSRQIVLSDIGYEGQLRLRGAGVALVGLGGLGSPTALKLAGMGVGLIRLIDRDIVSRSDLHRQYLYDTGQVGRPKVEAAAEKLKKLNPEVKLELYPEAFNQRNARELIEGVDVVIDGLDRPEPRYVVNRTCIALQVPYIFGAAVEAYGNVSTIMPGRTACLECFMGGLRNEDLPLCGVVGVHPSVLGIISALQVSEAVRLLTGHEPKLANRLLYFDMRDLELTIMNLRSSEECSVCSGSGAEPPSPVNERFFEEICSQDSRRTFILSPQERIEVAMEPLERLLVDRGVPVISSGPCGIHFEAAEDLTVFILKSGIMIARVAAGKGSNLHDRIIETYRALIVDDLGFSPSVIDSCRPDNP